jgi:glutamyl-tRNA synthetase
MEITHVVRGEEWISSAPKHVLLYEYFGWEMPKLVHLPLLRNPDKSKVSKRHSHTSLFWYRDQGYLVEAVINFLATRVWNHPKGKEVFGIEELTKHFDFSKMHILGPIVDLDKLDWLNGQWIRSKSDKELTSDLKPFLPGWLDEKTLIRVLPLIKERLHKLSEIGELTEYFVKAPKMEKKLFAKEAKHTNSEVGDYLSEVIEAVEGANWTVEALEKTLRDLQEKSGWKPRPAFMTIRIAITGQLHTPPLFDTMLVIGKEEVVKRLSHAKQNFS